MEQALTILGYDDQGYCYARTVDGNVMFYSERHRRWELAHEPPTTFAPTPDPEALQRRALGEQMIVAYRQYQAHRANALAWLESVNAIRAQLGLAPMRLVAESSDE